MFCRRVDLREEAGAVESARRTDEPNGADGGAALPTHDGHPQTGQHRGPRETTGDAADHEHVQHQSG